MRYWAYLFVKLAAIGLIVTALYAAILAHPWPPLPYGVHSQFLYDMPFTFCVVGGWLVGAGLLSLAIRDQRSRCRTCLRKLIMPLPIGSWSNLLTLGRPATEWICPFGHGTLRIEELQITGKEPPDWKPHEDDIWKELNLYR